MQHCIQMTKRHALLDFVDMCLQCREQQELELFFADLLTPHELVSLSERWTIAKLLHMGFSYRTIARKTGASTATISRMARVLMHGSGGLRKACQQRESAWSDRRPEIPPYTAFCPSF